MFFHLFTLCSACVSALVIVLNDCLRRNQKIGDLYDFEGGLIIGVHLAGAPVTKTATLLGFFESDSF
jgi:hypothetical protein